MLGVTGAGWRKRRERSKSGDGACVGSKRDGVSVVQVRGGRGAKGEIKERKRKWCVRAWSERGGVSVLRAERFCVSYVTSARELLKNYFAGNFSKRS